MYAQIQEWVLVLVPSGMKEQNTVRNGAVVQLGECLWSMHKARASLERNIYNHLITSEGKIGESEVQGYPWLHGKFESSLGCMRPCFKTNNQITKKM